MSRTHARCAAATLCRRIRCVTRAYSMRLVGSFCCFRLREASWSVRIAHLRILTVHLIFLYNSSFTYYNITVIVAVMAALFTVITAAIAAIIAALPAVTTATMAAVMAAVIAAVIAASPAIITATMAVVMTAVIAASPAVTTAAIAAIMAASPAIAIAVGAAIAAGAAKCKIIFERVSRIFSPGPTARSDSPDNCWMNPRYHKAVYPS